MAKKFIVTMPIAGSVTLEVEATNRHEALEAFWARVNQDGFDPATDFDDLTWEYHEEIVSGNVCHAHPSRVDIEAVRENASTEAEDA